MLNAQQPLYILDVAVHTPAATGGKEALSAIHQRKANFRELKVQFEHGPVATFLDGQGMPLMGGQLVDGHVTGVTRLINLLLPTLRNLLEKPSSLSPSAPTLPASVWLGFPDWSSVDRHACVDKLKYVITKEFPHVHFDSERVAWGPDALHALLHEARSRSIAYAEHEQHEARRYAGWNRPSAEQMLPSDIVIVVCDSLITEPYLSDYLLKSPRSMPSAIEAPLPSEGSVGFRMSYALKPHVLAEMHEAVKGPDGLVVARKALVQSGLGYPGDLLDYSHTLIGGAMVNFEAVSILGKVITKEQYASVQKENASWQRFCPNLSVGDLGIASMALALAHGACAFEYGWTPHNQILVFDQQENSQKDLQKMNQAWVYEATVLKRHIEAANPAQHPAAGV